MAERSIGLRPRSAFAVDLKGFVTRVFVDPSAFFALEGGPLPRRPAPLISPLLPPLAAGYGTQPRGPADLRPALQRVHYVNQGVRQMWPQLATSWPPPPPPFSIGRHELPPEQRAALEACAWGIAATLEHDAANALGLTDAAILIVLSGDR